MADTEELKQGGSGGQSLPESYPYDTSKYLNLDEFTEKDIQYKIPAKEFFRMISSSNDRLSSLEEETIALRALVMSLSSYASLQDQLSELDERIYHLEAVHGV